MHVGLYAQQRPHYTQYFLNHYLLNPALSGIENDIDFKAGMRRQWVGIEGAPQTTFASAHWSLGDTYLWKNALSMPTDEDHPMSDNYMQNYTASPAHHGVGAMVVMDKAGPLSRIDASLTYAYHLPLSGTLNLSVGVAAGITRFNLNTDNLQFPETGNYDPALQNTVVGQTKPDLGLGLWLYGAQFYAGASLQQILPQKLSFTKDAAYNTGKEVMHSFFTAGYKLFIDDEISIIPSIMIKYVKPAPLSFDTNLKLSFRDRFWIGGSYRYKDSFAGVAGLNINRMFNLTYAYEVSTSPLNKVSNGSHEIVLGIQLNQIQRAMGGFRMW